MWTLTAAATGSACLGAVSAGRAGGGRPVLQWMTRSAAVCLTAVDTAPGTWSAAPACVTRATGATRAAQVSHAACSEQWIMLVLQSCVTWTAASTATARPGGVSVTRAGMETRVASRRVTPGAPSTVSDTRRHVTRYNDTLPQVCAVTERVSAPTAGMGSTAPWRGVPATAGVTAPAPCPTTSRAGSVCARVGGTGPAATSGSSRTATTRLTTTRVSAGRVRW